MQDYFTNHVYKQHAHTDSKWQHTDPYTSGMYECGCISYECGGCALFNSLYIQRPFSTLKSTPCILTTNLLDSE